MKADEILALYLYRLSNRINADYWKHNALPFVMLFRECLNEYGWGKKLESGNVSLDQSEEMKALIDNNQYCLLNGCEQAPEICNEFVTVYMESKQTLWNDLRRQFKNDESNETIFVPDIKKAEQIDLTVNLCHWLFECQFTCSKLSLI